MHCITCNSILDKYEYEICSSCREEYTMPLETDVDRIYDMIQDVVCILRNLTKSVETCKECISSIKDRIEDIEHKLERG